MSFGGKDFTVPGNSNLVIPFGTSSIIPLNGGIKYYFSTANGGFYGSAEIGINFLSAYTYTYNSGNNGSGYNISKNADARFGLIPGIGYRIDNWDFSGKFNLVSDANYLGLRVAYVFGAK